MTAQRAARDMGIDATFVYGDPDQGWKISHFIPECTTLDPHDAEQGARAMHIARSLHESGVEVERRFDFFEEGKRYEAMLREQGRSEIPGYDELASKAAQLKRYVEGDNAPVCLTHNDFFDLNFLVDRDGDFSLIDWEYAGDGDIALELAAVWISPHQRRQLVAAYARRAAIDSQQLWRQVVLWRPWVLLLMAGWYEMRWQQSGDRQFITLADEIWCQLDNERKG